jgi:hypothetical protein
MDSFTFIVISFLCFQTPHAQLSVTNFGTLSSNRNDVRIIPLNDALYFVGGQLDIYADGQIAISSTMEIYNTKTSSWTTSQLNKARYYAANSFTSSYFVFGGGLECYGPGAGNTCTNFEGSTTVDIVFSNSTQRIASMANNRYQLTATATPKKAYFAGGRTSTSFSSIVEILDVGSMTWQPSTSLSLARSELTSTAVGDKVMVAGGRTNDCQSSDWVLLVSSGSYSGTSQSTGYSPLQTGNFQQIKVVLKSGWISCNTYYGDTGCPWNRCCVQNTYAYAFELIKVAPNNNQMGP